MDAATPKPSSGRPELGSSRFQLLSGTSALALVRDFILAGLMLAAFALALAGTHEKSAPQEKVRLADSVPEEFGNWAGFTHDTKGFSDRWDSINELLVREYAFRPPLILRSPREENIGFILEYTSDLRKNFSFHFPEDCHRAGGNQVEFQEPLRVTMADGKELTAKVLFIRGLKKSYEPVDKLVVYWLVMDGKRRWQTFPIKLDQMLAGLLSGSKKGMLVRVDYFRGLEYSPQSIERARGTITLFMKDLYARLPEAERAAVFGRP